MSSQSPGDVVRAMRQSLGMQELASTTPAGKSDRPYLSVRLHAFGRRPDLRDVVATTVEVVLWAFCGGQLMLGFLLSQLSNEPILQTVFSALGAVVFGVFAYVSAHYYRKAFISRLRASDLALSLAIGEVDAQLAQRVNWDVESPPRDSLQALVWKLAKHPANLLGYFTYSFSPSWFILYYGLVLIWPVFTVFASGWALGHGLIGSSSGWPFYLPLIELALPSIMLAHMRTLRHRELADYLAALLNK